MITFEVKKRRKTVIIGFCPAKGATLETLRELKKDAARLEKIPPESVIIRYRRA